MNDLRPLYVSPRTPGAPTYGPAAAALMAWENRKAMPWQVDALDRALELDDEGRWKWRTVVVTVPRQNGKTTPGRAVVRHRLVYPPASGWGLGDLVDVLGVADKRELARETWDIVTRSFETPARRRLMAHRPRRANGDETLGLITGGRYRIAAANENAGHGWSLDLVWLDELWNIGAAIAQGVLPAQRARPNPQTWITSTAGTDGSEWLKSWVELGRAGAPGVCLIEYGAPDDADPADPATWAPANPALGHTLREAELADAFRTMELAEFERAHLNRWTTTATRAIPPAWWAAAGDPDAAVPATVGRVAVALDLDVNRNAGAVAIAGLDAGRTVVELVDHRPGTDWLAARALDLWRRWRPAAIYLDPFGPANTVADELDRLRVPVVRVNAGQLTAACAGLYDDLRDDRFRHRRQAALDSAVDGAVRRTVLDRWAFSRGNSAADISPLNAATLARYALADAPKGSTVIRTAG